MNASVNIWISTEWVDVRGSCLWIMMQLLTVWCFINLVFGPKHTFIGNVFMWWNNLVFSLRGSGVAYWDIWPCACFFEWAPDERSHWGLVSLIRCWRQVSIQVDSSTSTFLHLTGWTHHSQGCQTSLHLSARVSSWIKKIKIQRALLSFRCHCIM